MEMRQIERRKPSPERMPPPETPEREQEDRAAMAFFLESGDLDAESALEVVGGYSEQPTKEAVEGVKAIAGEYGLLFDELAESEQRKYTTLFHSAVEARRDSSGQKIAQTFEKELKKELFTRALQVFDQAEITITESEDREELEQNLTDTMEYIRELAKRLPPDEESKNEQKEKTEEEKENEPWMLLYKRFLRIMSIRRTSKEKGKDEEGNGIEEVFQSVVEKNRDFIEDDIYSLAMRRRHLLKQAASSEHVMHEIYQRSQEEVEDLKKRNRKVVAQYIRENREEPPSVEVLQTLHRLNNADLVPKRISELRKEDEGITFLKRVGIFGGEDVEKESENVIDRASRAMFSTMSDTRFELTVAALHNDLLEIHPFADRNGSTSLLFAEFMMSKRGYTPSPERELGPERKEGAYYNTVRKILGNNALAVGLVAQAQWRMATFSGYYRGETTKKGKLHGVSKPFVYEKSIAHYIETLRERRKGEKEKEKKKKNAA